MTNKIFKLAFQPIDNAPLIVFRMLFGLLIAAECWGAIATGWVKRILIEPEFTFTIPCFEWLQPLPGYGMYFWFFAIGLCGIMIMLGWFYRLAIICFTVLWGGVYHMQISSYNNHYYLLLLVAFVMCWLPAHRYASLDVKQERVEKCLSMPLWISWLIIAQLAVVYFYATKAKFYPDWLDGTFTELLFAGKKNWPLIGELFQEKWFHLFIAWSGLAYDGLIVPALLWRKTRTYAFFASLFFHLFNSFTLLIGIFPYFALSFILFFYPPEQIRSWFLKKKPPLEEEHHHPHLASKNILQYVFIPYLIIQLLLPLRHHLIEGNVFWTEEAHRHAWRMMLRTKSGATIFKVKDLENGEEWNYATYKKLTKKQMNTIRSKPEAIMQMAKRIRKEYESEGRQVAVFVDARVSLNRRERKILIDPEIDLSRVGYNLFKHNDWIVNYTDEEIFRK